MPGERRFLPLQLGGSRACKKDGWLAGAEILSTKDDNRNAQEIGDLSVTDRIQDVICP